MQPDQDSVSLRDHFMALMAEMDRRFGASLAETNLRFDAQLAAQDKAVQIAMVASEKAVVKAEIAAEKRFEATNEFRGQLSDQAATFMPRVEAEQRLMQLGEKIEDVKGSNRAGASALWGYLAGGLGIVLAIAAILLR